LSSLPQDEVSQALDRLTSLLYLHRVPDGWRFHHALLRDVAYGRLTTAERMQLHARYAEKALSQDDAEAFAHHLWEALGPDDADWVWESRAGVSALRDRARAAHIAAARRYSSRATYERAVDTCRRARRFATAPPELAEVEQALADAYGLSGAADEAVMHYLRARGLLLEAGSDPPPSLYPSLLELPVYTSGMFRQLPAAGLVDELLHEGEAIARRHQDRTSLARILALRAYRSHDSAQLAEALQLSEVAEEPVTLWCCLSHAAILLHRVGTFALAKRTYERLDAIAAARLTDRQFEFRAILELNLGNVRTGEQFADQFRTATAGRGPHLRTHAFREQAHVLLARGNWAGLVDLAEETGRVVAQHPETSFCYAVTTVLAFAAVAHMLEGQVGAARALLEKVEAPLQAEPLERESLLILTYAVMGNANRVQAIIRQVEDSVAVPFWFFRRMQAVALTMLEQWADLPPILGSLERVAQPDNPHLTALASAIREEIDAAHGGPRPSHSRLRELGYTGWSRLLAHRARAAERAMDAT